MAAVHQRGEGLWQLELPLPIPRLPSVNCYAFTSDDGVTLVDPGGGHDAGYEALRDGLAALDLPLTAIKRMVITHLHPDHMGLATRLREEVGAEYTMHSRAKDHIDQYNDWGPFRAAIADLTLLHGASTDQADVLRQDDERPAWAPRSMVPSEFVDDGDLVDVGNGRTLEVVHTPGHEAAHICLIDSRTGALFTGDHVLPRITPFVPFPPDEPDNLGTYLESLRRVEEIDPYVTYPAHGVTIERGAARARQITLHHSRRLLGMLEELDAGPRTAWEIMGASFKPNMPPMHTRLAFQETLAHLEYLRTRNRIERFDDGGVLRYRKP